MLDQTLLQLLEVRQVQLMTGGDFAGVAQQVADFRAAPVRHVLIHRRVVGRCGMDHPLDFLLQIERGCRLTATLQQLGQFRAQRGDFALMLLQSAVTAIVKHGQWIDRAIERQFAPQPGEDVGAPFMGMFAACRSSSQIGATG